MSSGEANRRAVRPPYPLTVEGIQRAFSIGKMKISRMQNYTCKLRTISVRVEGMVDGGGPSCRPFLLNTMIESDE